LHLPDMLNSIPYICMTVLIGIKQVTVVMVLLHQNALFLVSNRYVIALLFFA